MTTAIKRRRGTTTQHSTFTGLEGEITVDTTKDTLVVHDGSTAGGFALLREDLSNNTNVASTSATQTFTNKTFGDNPTFSAGTANSIPYLNGSKVLTTGSALTFDGTNLGLGIASPVSNFHVYGANQAITINEVGAGGSGVASCRLKYGTNNWGTYVGGVDALVFYNYGAGSEQMRLTSTGLGIGTSSPSAKLEVASSGAIRVSASGSSNALEIYSNTNGSFFEAKNSSPLICYTGGAERLRLDSSGNLGLGVTPSAWSGFTASQVSRGSIAANTSELDLSHNAYYDGSNWRYIANGFATNHYQYNGTYAWRTAPSGTAGNAISFTQAMTLDASGNLVVGGTTALVTAGSRGNITVNGSTSSIYSLGVSNTAIASLYADATVVNLSTRTAVPFLFSTNDTERMRIDSSGNVQVSNLAGTGNRAVYSTSTGILTNSSSDRSLKENDTPISQGLDAVLAMRPISYEWIDKEKMGAQREIGFIAQEMQQIVPEVVGSNSDETLSIDYPKLVAVMAKAIQELKAELDATKAEVAALKAIN